jgi:hypothetical protein
VVLVQMMGAMWALRYEMRTKKKVFVRV